MLFNIIYAGFNKQTENDGKNEIARALNNRARGITLSFKAENAKSSQKQEFTNCFSFGFSL